MNRTRKARLIDPAAALMSAAHTRPEDDNQPTELGRRIMERMAARQAAKAYSADQVQAIGQKVSVTA